MGLPFSFSSLSGVRVVKSIGRSIGAVVEPSEFDGDGDGFVMGRDGRDNVPAPRRVVDAVEGVGRVSDLLKPTDDLFEVRRSGRPWKPLLFDGLPDDVRKDISSFVREVNDVLYERGKKERVLKKVGDDRWGKGWIFKSPEDFSVDDRADAEDLIKKINEQGSTVYTALNNANYASR